MHIYCAFIFTLLLIISAVQLALNQSIDGINPPNIKLQDVKTIRSLASDITQSGAKLYDLLESESIDRQDRAQAIRHLETIAAAQGLLFESQILFVFTASDFTDCIYLNQYAH